MSIAKEIDYCVNHCPFDQLTDCPDICPLNNDYSGLSPRIAKRMAGIQMIKRGACAFDIAKEVGVQIQTATNWRQLYREALK